MGASRISPTTNGFKASNGLNGNAAIAAPTRQLMDTRLHKKGVKSARALGAPKYGVSWIGGFEPAEPEITRVPPQTTA